MRLMGVLVLRSARENITKGVICLKYIAVNELDHFEYHDAELRKIAWKDTNLVWELSAVNVTTENTQNNSCKDMCIESAEIMFESCNIESIIFSACGRYDSNGALIESVEAEIALPEEYDEILRESLSSYCYIFSMNQYEKTESGKYWACFTIDGGAGHYDITISFLKSIVSWDMFSGEAWYEHPQWKNNTRP